MTLRRLVQLAVLAASVALASSALAAGPLDAVRATARAAREQVGQLRSSQLAQRNELSQLSARIEQLKAKQKGALLPGGELDAALKRSQELSASLSTLASQVPAREGELEAAQLALLASLSDELSRLRADFDRQTDRQARRGLIDDMKRLRAEREAVRAALPQARLPALDALQPSDDPTELLGQADLLRDNEEKLRRELKALDSRIAERRQEADLDRRVQRFLGEESMFDDQDRRLRVQRTSSLEGVTGAPANVPGRANTGPDTAGSPIGSFDRGPAGAPLGGSVDQGDGVRVVNASDARPQLGGARPVALSDEDQLQALAAERARLGALADELKQKADALERQAAQLH